jgi:hypothetical protein
MREGAKGTLYTVLADFKGMPSPPPLPKGHKAAKSGDTQGVLAGDKVTCQTISNATGEPVVGDPAKFNNG